MGTAILDGNHSHSIKVISHRGNLTGPHPATENSPDQITEVLSLGFDVEVDLWFEGDGWWFGHDLPQYKTNESYLREISRHAWFHAKNKGAFEGLLSMGRDIQCFWHQEDRFTLTSKGIPWCYPNNECDGGVVVLKGDSLPSYSSKILGVCTDYPLAFKSMFARAHKE
jgi:hypothetical protein